MKTYPTIILLILLACFGSLRAQESISLIELPLQMHTGYSVFHFRHRGLTPYPEGRENNKWEKTYIYGKGIPQDWTEVKQGAIEVNINQTIYQDYLAGNLSEEFYENIQQSWNWTPNLNALSAKPIKTKAVFAIGKDASGEERLVVDRNNNLDFSDDEIFTPVDAATLLLKEQLDDVIIYVSFEFYEHNKVITKRVPIAIAKQGNGYIMNIPQYATTEFEGQQIALYSNWFADLTWRNVDAILLSDAEGVTDRKLIESKTASLNNYLTINHTLYKNKGVDTNKNVLMLEKTTVPKDQLYVNQFGFRAPLFQGEEFTKKEKISLEAYRGKYVLLDFWAVWCPPCIQEMPNLKALYDETDRSQFEIIGIVGRSEAKALVSRIEKHGITWPQLMSDKENDITKLYNVDSYPTVLLLDPNGVIIDKDLRGKKLDKRIKELLQK